MEELQPGRPHRDILCPARTGPVPSRRIGLHLALMAMWEITITCHDGTRLRLSEWRDAAPHKGQVVETVDTGQVIKAMIDACREEKVGGSRPPFFQVTATEVQ